MLTGSRFRGFRFSGSKFHVGASDSEAFRIWISRLFLKIFSVFFLLDFLVCFGWSLFLACFGDFVHFFSGAVCNFFAALTCAGYLSILSFAVGFRNRLGVVHIKSLCTIVVAVPLIWRFVHSPHFSCSAMNPVFFGAFCCFFIVSVGPLQSFARRRTIENTL